MKKKTLLSVDMITYNHEPYIKEAIEGVLMQETNFEYELIIADDCSPDNTPIIINDIIKNHPKGHRIKYFRHKENLGMQANGLFALQQCTGKYIALCEGDDYWTDPLKLQKQVDFLEDNKEFALCGSLAKRIYDDDTILSDIEGEAGVFEQIDIAEQNFIPTASVLFQRSHINNFPDWFLECPVGDWPLFLICSSHGKIKIFKEQMVVRRIHQGGIWGANINSKNSIKNVMRLVNMFSILKDKFCDDVNSVLNKNYLRQLIKIVELSIKKEDFDKAAQYLERLLQQGIDLPEETKRLVLGISKKMTNQEEEIKQLKSLNTQLLDSTSYKLGRQITGVFKFLKT
jgi:glycosyltransferase involved in cell wall biosynthesis